jgi:hypothetical protein
MNEMDQLKNMLDVMQLRRMSVEKQIADFKKLQGEIAQLYARADTDPDAMKKVQKLDAVMQGEGKAMFESVVAKAPVVSKTFDRLGRQLKQLMPDDVKVPENVVKEKATEAKVAVRAPIAKKHRRSFA